MKTKIKSSILKRDFSLSDKSLQIILFRSVAFRILSLFSVWCCAYVDYRSFNLIDSTQNHWKFVVFPINFSTVFFFLPFNSIASISRHDDDVWWPFVSTLQFEIVFNFWNFRVLIVSMHFFALADERKERSEKVSKIIMKKKMKMQWVDGARAQLPFPLIISCRDDVIKNAFRFLFAFGVCSLFFSFLF